MKRENNMRKFYVFVLSVIMAFAIISVLLEGTVKVQADDGIPVVGKQAKAVGEVITYNGIKYKVTEIKLKNVNTVGTDGKTNQYKVWEGYVECCQNKNVGTTLVIPDTIEDENHVKYYVMSIAKNAFKNNKKLKTLKIGCTVNIGTSAFQNCISLKSIDLTQAGGVVIGKNAFKGCIKLSKLKMDSVLSIGTSAFEGCSSLKKANIDAEVIGAKAFYNCSKLSKVDIQTSSLKSKKVGKSAFKKISENAKISVGKGYKKYFRKSCDATAEITERKIEF